MADDIPRQVFEIKDLPTKTVTLYPSRAHVVREIRDVVLEPGPNEIEVYGVTPSTDEQSVQIDGRGAATITDMTVELVPNKHNFDDEFPEQEQELSDEDIEPYEDSDDEEEALKALRASLKTLKVLKDETTEKQLAKWKQLETLDNHMKTIEAKYTDPDKLAQFLKVYDEQRAAAYKVYSQAIQDVKSIQKKIDRKEHEITVASKDEKKRKAKLAREKQKAQDKKWRRLADKRKEESRVKTERLKFWAKQVYRVVVRLETATIDTPASSRRNSMDGITLAAERPLDKDGSKAQNGAADGCKVTLSLSYVTAEASWTPRYDINISSLQKTATIAYRGEFSNETSETWTDTKLVLSTSQTSFSGLDDKPPTMHPWSIKLGKGYEAGNSGLFSAAEVRERPSGGAKAKAVAVKANRGALFGATQQQQQQHQQQVQSLVAQQRQPSSLFAQQTTEFPSQAFGQQPGGAFGAAAPDSNLAASNSYTQSAWAPQMQSLVPPPVAMIGHSPPHLRAVDDGKEPSRGGDLEEGVSGLFGSARGETALDFEEAEWEDNGLTATYEVPGTRTLAPSSLKRRHKIASLHATNIQLSYIAIPKLRAAAFLRARIRNPSATVTLLKGQAGVTLDGSFLGNMALPRVSPSQPFSVALGTDPAIHVNYPKPAVRRSTQGLFNKESANLFSRSVWLSNTRPQPVELLVLDQVPCSQDERLRVDILQPKGLAKEGDAVRAGQPAKEGAQHANWGKAVAHLKKNGEVNWTVNLEKGQACLLKLEYEARLPSSDSIVNC